MFHIQAVWFTVNCFISVRMGWRVENRSFSPGHPVVPAPSVKKSISPRSRSAIFDIHQGGLVRTCRLFCGSLSLSLRSVTSSYSSCIRTSFCLNVQIFPLLLLQDYLYSLALCIFRWPFSKNMGILIGTSLTLLIWREFTSLNWSLLTHEHGVFLHLFTALIHLGRSF